MSDSGTNPDSQREALAEAFGGNTDPLAKHSSTFDQNGIDPFLLFEEDVLNSRSIGKATLQQYDIVFRQWTEHMAEVGRHPTCPNEQHVKGFAHHELNDKENTPSVVKEKIRKLNEVYEYWVAEPGFPHQLDYNPFALARSKINFDDPGAKDPPQISTKKLREIIESVDHLRNRAIIIMQLKLGLRAGELGNIQLSEVSLRNQVVQDHYPEMGTHPRLEEHKNAVYIPRDREGNKSQNSRILPLDDETRRALLRFLLIRPDNGEPWLLLSHDHHEKMGNQGMIKAWKDAFHPEYEETERHRSVTSHFGRHYFTTFWTHRQDTNRELVKYMRGDTTSDSMSDGPRDAIDTYIHTYYKDIEAVYRENIFKIGV